MKWLLLIAVLVAVALLATRGIWRGPTDRAPPPPAARISADCEGPAEFAEAARANARDFAGLPWAPFGVEERGWDAYAPVIAREVGTDCAPDSPGFAAALARWQAGQKLPATGRVDAASFEKMRVAWMLRRPFVIATRQGQCPQAPAEATLAQARPEEGYWRKPVQLRPAALEAYRKLVAAARRDVPDLAADPELLTIVSGYRNPQADAARCAAAGNCGGPARANCSAHLTGLATDLYVGAAPGQDPTSSTDTNRSFQAQTRLYAWMARNAERFGFVGYPYEPWHWEWTGEPVTP
ncbi:D-alanyl-D-alanine carboxypeptidase family protein [Phenylobacterium sp.]|uniref:D-alanyl-D-alanine carboxypeptidase family protein n=1 Tax=Phenylobacterium sp. TaxID=1871053 RepID=UPI002BB6C01A|nr:D-alanyl-D-alanine carboxypeptidase family protein [Phenylobacterium sp.]HVI34528.1 D-alanyl-D-alanine carboxypeptidase family protein [Phenylobacterium sp.]